MKNKEKNESANIAEAAARPLCTGPEHTRALLNYAMFRFIFKKQIRNKMIHTGAEVLCGRKKCDCVHV